MTGWSRGGGQPAQGSDGQHRRTPRIDLFVSCGNDHRPGPGVEIALRNCPRGDARATATESSRLL
jgi:hypothetical protein